MPSLLLGLLCLLLCSPARGNETLNPLMAWGDATPWVYHSGVELATFSRILPGGGGSFPLRGMRATRDMKAGEMVVQIPIEQTVSRLPIEAIPVLRDR
jgi:hypothetical protein